jgi:two-component system sporulation sensor kinase A
MSNQKPDSRSQFLRIPGLFARLGSLIVLQGLFIFAALGVILFHPDESALKTNPQTESRRWLSSIGQQFADSCLAGFSAQSSERLTHIETVSGSGDSLVSAGLIAVHPDGGLSCIAAIDQNGEVVSSGQIPYVAGGFDENLIRVAAAQPPGFALTSIESSSQSTFYGTPVWGRREPVVFVAEVNHRYVISERNDLAYVVFMLFLVSALLSLLTAYLMVKKVQEPLSRLSLNLKKSSGRDLTGRAASDETDELAGLANSADRIAVTLREQRDEIRDFTSELQMAHTELAESERFLSTLIDASPSCVIATTADDRIILFNQEAQKTFGYSSEDVIGRAITDLLILPPDWPPTSDLPPNHQREVLCRCKDRQQFPALLSAAPIPDPIGHPSACLFLLRDITESRGFQEMMVRLDRYSTRGEMAGEIAHEINNYLAVLSGNIELMPLLMKKGDQEKITKKLEMMRATCDKIAKFTDGLMDGGPEETAFFPHNVNQIVENVLAFLKPQNKFDRIEFRTELDSRLPQVPVDAGQIQQLLVNLIHNSADALAERKEGAMVSVRTFRGPDNPEATVCLQVQDNGPGVVADKVGLLFVKRFTTKKRGHGIGLITCRKIMDSHKGSIAYRLDEGAVFTTTISTMAPVAPVPPETVTAQAPASLSIQV